MIPFSWHAPPPGVRIREDRGRPWCWFWRRRKPSDPRSWNLVLASAGIGVPVGMAIDSPGLLTVVVEDLQWCLAMKELRARRPRRWQRAAMARWTAERDRLEEDRLRIARIAAEALSSL